MYRMVRLHTKRLENRENFLRLVPFRSWSVIDQQSESETVSNGNPSSSAFWKTIRVFVSSTFTDYHSEREVLVKQVLRSFD